MRRKLTSLLIGLGITGTSLFAMTGSAQGHGYTDSPVTSRQKLCANRTVANCGSIVWEPQSVEGLKGFPAAGPADGTICAGGNSRFSELDDPRGGAWPATRVSGGSAQNFTWRFTARHSTTDFRYYITKDGYNPSQRLTRAALESQPFLVVPYRGQPPESLSHSGTLPRKTGKHLILAVWTIADTGNAFYACSDVQF
ncbi:lytic polysaccharide monooxygenase [Streptomyces clavuligerus]|uniref:Chitin-binding protein n=3 Tax=Streptomyces clavuligerus TaxID=1901 RepID=B5GNV5_STRCL|nr:lytic polysaccharide monooxygenase auxiliary activity family 9 protein [Streptomyces clavuligerus]ANW18813.1 chitin-binding protein [Streptomyces clavuligerus]AXU13382.1 chitin-binding protein [Streptomyces clavuligerus]EDY47927.1 chitin-binding protein [Streptomyces clavuligerus]EFG08502.1 Chitin-binding protein [Streptomyces clavuligerus]MBY6303339.1 lytic polysaccharide monooxygenase [Streptomyces clavuligerus]